MAHVRRDAFARYGVSAKPSRTIISFGGFYSKNEFFSQLLFFNGADVFAGLRMAAIFSDVNKENFISSQTRMEFIVVKPLIGFTIRWNVKKSSTKEGKIT